MLCALQTAIKRTLVFYCNSTAMPKGPTNPPDFFYPNWILLRISSLWCWPWGWVGQEVGLVFPQNNMSFLAGSNVDSCRGRMGKRWADRARTAQARWLLNRAENKPVGLRVPLAWKGPHNIYFNSKCYWRSPGRKIKERTGPVGISWAFGSFDLFAICFNPFLPVHLSSLYFKSLLT